MIATVVAATLNVGLNYLLIPILGYMAAAYTTLIANIVLTVMQFIFCKKVQKEDMFNSKFIWLIACFVVLLCLLCNLLYTSTVLRYIIITGIFVLLCLNRKKIVKNIKFMKEN